MLNQNKTFSYYHLSSNIKIADSSMWFYRGKYRRNSYNTYIFLVVSALIGFTIIEILRINIRYRLRDETPSGDAT